MFPLTILSSVAISNVNIFHGKKHTLKSFHRGKSNWCAIDYASMQEAKGLSASYDFLPRMSFIFHCVERACTLCQLDNTSQNSVFILKNTMLS